MVYFCTEMKPYADVILPLPLPRTFTYRVPEELIGTLRPGCRVVVPFGRKKYYTALVCRVHAEKPVGYEVRDVSALLDREPVLLPVQFTFWQWLADYYLCSVGDVYKAALPSGLKLESETVVEYNPDFEADEPLSEREQAVLDELSRASQQAITKLQQASGVKDIVGVVKRLMDRGAIFVREEMRQAYKPRTEARVKLAGAETLGEERLKTLFDRLGKAPRQLDLLMKYIELSGCASGRELREVSKKELLLRSGSSPAAFNSLVEKGVFETYRFEVGRLDRQQLTESELNPLNEFQQRAYDQIRASFRQKNVCLLQGVTGSGKTEIYIHLIRETLRQGKQVLYLLPEIALTAQITTRLKRVFGNRLGIYHSKYPDAERVEMWQSQLQEAKEYDIILGVRSSVFLPFRRLGLVIVDEEHETTYKQQDPAPRYHARNAAIMLASYYHACTLLGTATPSVESWFNAIEGKYGMVLLHERYKEMQLPRILPVDIGELLRKKRMTGQFSPLLVEHMAGALSRKEQVILFQNRRGFAPMIECRTCGWVPKCKHCDVSLTYHKGMNQLTCHYCGYTESVPRSCPACEGQELNPQGFGTEKVEEDVRTLFPQAKVARMDLDTTRTRTAYEKIIADFEQGKTDVLIGTQMVSKGLDFDHVSVVGILNADTLMNYPDFRAYERAYQLMAQVSGRAGRKNKQGTVILQTRSLEHPLIAQVMANDYPAMVKGQLNERKLFHYPPYHRLVYVYLKNRNERLLDLMARTMASRLRAIFGNRVLGPDHPPVKRIQSLYIKKIVVKIETGASLAQVRELLHQVQQDMLAEEPFKSLIVYYDVDPV